MTFPEAKYVATWSNILRDWHYFGFFYYLILLDYRCGTWANSVSYVCTPRICIACIHRLWLGVRQFQGKWCKHFFTSSEAAIHHPVSLRGRLLWERTPSLPWTYFIFKGCCDMACYSQSEASLVSIRARRSLIQLNTEIGPVFDEWARKTYQARKCASDSGLGLVFLVLVMFRLWNNVCPKEFAPRNCKKLCSKCRVAIWRYRLVLSLDTETDQRTWPFRIDLWVLLDVAYVWRWDLHYITVHYKGCRHSSLDRLLQLCLGKCLLEDALFYSSVWNSRVLPILIW